jgi:transposase
VTAAPVQPGERVAILALNSHQYLEVYMAVPASGRVVVPLNTRHAEPELRYALEDSGTRVLITDRDPGAFVEKKRIDVLEAHGPDPATLEDLEKSTTMLAKTLGWTAQIVAHPPRYKKVWVPKDIPPDQIDWSTYLPPPGFRVLPRRWVVERTFAWQGQQRRLSKDYERLCATSEALIYVTMIRLMVRRLARF